MDNVFAILMFAWLVYILCGCDGPGEAHSKTLNVNFPPTRLICHDHCCGVSNQPAAKVNADSLIGPYVSGDPASHLATA